MRFLHTSDWHLGRIFHGMSLVDEQAYVLRQVKDLLTSTDVEALVISGDIYDRAIPPVEAIELLDSFLSEVVLGLSIPTLVIAGNHDSPERLSFAAKLMTGRGLHVVGQYPGVPEPIVLKDSHGEVSFYAIPYADPPVIRESLLIDTINDHASGMAATLSEVTSRLMPGSRSVILAHAFVAGGTCSDSERPLSVAGAGTVPVDLFAPFSYTALGHLHRPQIVGSERVQYSGSLLRYSFSEVTHEKSVSLVEIDGSGSVRVERLPLHPRRELRIVQGPLQEIVERAPRDSRPQDLLLVRLDDEGPVLDPLGKLRPYYPNVLAIERSCLRKDGRNPERERAHAIQTGRFTDRDLYRVFFEEVTGTSLSDDESSLLGELIETWKPELAKEIQP